MTRCFLAPALIAALALAPSALGGIQPQGRTFQATAGQEFSGVVAEFLTDEQGPFSTSISWGDAGQSTGTASCANCPAQPATWQVTGSHTYAQPASYDVAVSILSSQQSTATAQSTAVVSAPPKPADPPIAAFASAPQSPTTGQTIVLNGSGSQARSGLIVKYEWILDGARPLPCDGSTPIAHGVFLEPGTHEVTLRVTDSNGLVGSVAHAIAVSDAGELGPVASSGCGAAEVGLAPGLRGPPQVQITEPEELAYYDRAPATLPVSGKVKAPEGIEAFCLTGPTPADAIPKDCDQAGVVNKGKFTVLIVGMKPGHNYVDAWVRDKTGKVAHDERVLSVATSTNGIDLRADALEVTQAVQNTDLPLKTPADYDGVGLAAGGKTIVRFFVDAPQPSNFPKRDVVKDVEAALYGYRDGKLLSPTPLLSEEGAQEVSKGIDIPYARAQPGYKPLFTFTLPPSWTHGTISLTAIVNPPDLAPSIAECKTCFGNDDFELRKISFTPTFGYQLRLAKLLYHGAGLEFALPAEEAFGALRTVEPLGDGQLETPPYAATIDLGISGTDPGGSKVALAKLFDWAFWDYYYAKDPPDTYMGAQAGSLGGATVGSPVPFSRPGKLGFTFKYIGEGRTTRPLTSLAHEFGHILGRLHASKSCGGNDNGQRGEDWPDPKGLLQGVGIDRRGLPYRVYPPSFFDFMSYCANTNESDSWISTINWQRELKQFETHGFDTLRAPNRAAADAPMLRVSGYADVGGVHLVGVEPLAGQPSAGTPSSYRLVTRNGAGGQVASVPLTTAPAHADRDERHRAEQFVFLAGQVPARGAAALEILRDGEAAAKRAASAHAPVVRILEPRSGQEVGRNGKATIRWRATDADRDRLSVRLEYASAGSRWRPVYTGGNTGRTVIPSRYLKASKGGHIRIVISDGLRSAAAISGRFQSLGGPPVASIWSPARRARISAEAAVYLSGTAYDDSDRSLAGPRLRWLVGRRLLGSGRTLSVLGLPPGTQRITLEARDAAGRIGRASVLVGVRAAKPRFLRLRAPRRLARNARSVVLRVATTVPSVLRIGRIQARVDRTPRQIVVPIRRGTAPIVLRLRLASGGKSSVVVLRIPRR